MVVVDSDLKPHYAKAIPRKIHAFKKANWTKIREDTESFKDDFLLEAPNRDVQTNWGILKTHLQKMMDKFIPSSLKSSRRNLPWFTNSLKRTIKKAKAIQQSKEVEQTRRLGLLQKV